ncbi:hypothetical protein PoB_002109100 [Plakobranchus ocellatus]|uniref:Uncharacterized protein n=1 Tax=Plakobranchus ocellatus TaxID=259542 RepID=A0AAV3ZIY5_9GAST|nr:hypothetical protein PoB_002109100 [Plakobranchus ocellatus]
MASSGLLSPGLEADRARPTTLNRREGSGVMGVFLCGSRRPSAEKNFVLQKACQLTSVAAGATGLHSSCKLPAEEYHCTYST